MIEGNNVPIFDELEFIQDNIIPTHCETYGDQMDEYPPQDTTRIYVQNLNGLRWDEDGGRWPYICDVMSSIQVDIACFSELNTDTNQYRVREKMESICQQHFSQSRLVAATTSYETKRTYKPGGTAILACNTISTQIKSHTRDRMGRWSSLAITTSSQTIRIISAYQVCSSQSRGATTASSQQAAQLMLEQCRTNSSHRRNPREAFIQDLQSFILQCQTLHEVIILTGDFNEDITSQRAGMKDLVDTCGLVDLFAARLGTSEHPTTYQRGTKRIDYTLISPLLLPHIQAAGYEPFGYRIPSDHRGMFIDFSTQALFHQILAPLAPRQKRGFSSKQPGLVNAYVTAKLNYLYDHRFFSRLDSLLSQEVPNNELAEALDRDFQRAAKHAAKICTRKTRPPWSPKLAAIWATLHFYRIARSACRTQANYKPALTKLQAQWQHLPREIPTDLQVINTEYKVAIQQLKSARAKARELRDEYLLQKVDEYSHNDEKSKVRAIQRILRAENQRKVYDKLRYIRNGNNEAAGLSQIKVPIGISPTDTNAMKALPDTPDHWETVTTPKRIESILLSRNRHHFGQAQQTPFATPPLEMEVGYKADGLIVDMILTGQVQQSAIPQAARLLVKHLQQRSSTTIDDKITIEQIVGKLKVWDETTTTSPSGIHLGHYHCMWRPPTQTDDKESMERIKKGQKLLLQATAALMNYAIRYGYSYDRWTKVVNTMLQKDAGNPRLHRLRVIHIYEADYNLLLAVKWRQALHHAEDNKILNDGLYGSRPGRTANDPVLLEVLQNEIYRTSMKSGINFDLDAMSCYDRILVNVASICSRRIGMPTSVAFVNANTLERAQYHLKTNLGVSDGSYTHCSEQPIYGTGQGSGNSPAIWCFVCSALFDATETVTSGAIFSSYCKQHNVHIFMIGFVDDCTQRVNKFQDEVQPNARSLVRTMEHDAQQWNNVLWASGGALEQTKCSFHLIESAWNDDGHPFLQGGTSAESITLKDGGKSNSVTQKSNYESHKTLGCYINPAHSNNSTWLATQTKNKKFTRLLEANFLTRTEAWTFYTAIYIPSITYAIPMAPLTVQQCTDLNSKFLRVLLPRLGYNRNIASELRYAPQIMGGIGLKHLYAVQGLLLLQQIFKYLNSPTTTIGKMLQITLSWTQAFLGVSNNILADTHQRLPVMGPSLLLDLRQFLKSIDAKLSLANPSGHRLLRVHDRFIMDIALNQTCWTQRQVIQINSCRRYLQALTLADICINTGTRLTNAARVSHCSPSSDVLRVSRFNQQRPGKRAWQTWTKFLRTISNKDGVLYQHLGQWTVPHLHTRMRQPFVYDPRSKQLYSHYHGDLYQAHAPIHPKYYTITPYSQPVKINGYPTSVVQVMDRLYPLKDYAPIPPPEVSYNSTTETFHPPWQRILLAGVKHLKSRDTIIHHIRHENILTCSDGSASQLKSSYGFIVSTRQGIRLARGNGPALGSSGNSFRSEAYGVLATMVWAQALTKNWLKGFENWGTWTHYLDNQSVIHRIKAAMNTSHVNPNSELLPDQDIIKEIAATISQLPWSIELEWVKGHQDSHIPYHQLPLEAQMNCQADTEAALYEPTPSPLPLPMPLPHSPCQLWVHGQPVTRAIKQRIMNAATIPHYHSYLLRRYNWPPNVIDTIDWDMYSTLITRHKHMWPTMVKHLHDISPTGHIAHRNNPSLPHNCPACQAPFEDNAHVICCPAPARARWRSKLLSNLRRWDNAQSDPVLIDILQDGLRRFFSSITILPEEYPAEYHDVIKTQNSIGWHQLFKARWSQQWSVRQNAYRAQHPNLLTLTEGNRWVAHIGHMLLTAWHDLWNIRNDQRHGQDKIQQDAFQLQIITAELHELYSLKHEVCPTDKHIFYDSVNEHLQRHQNSHQIEEWIHLYRDAIRASAKTAMQLGIHRTRHLMDYPMFNPAIRPAQQASLTAGLSPG